MIPVIATPAMTLTSVAFAAKPGASRAMNPNFAAAASGPILIVFLPGDGCPRAAPGETPPDSIHRDAARLDRNGPFRDVVLEKASEIVRAAPLRSDDLDTEAAQPVAERW